MDGVHIFKATILSSSSLEHEGFNPIPSAYLDYGPYVGEGMMTKVKMLYNQSNNMATMTSHFASSFKIWNAFLMGKMKINNEQKKKIKINNLKVIKNLGVILKEEFRSKVKIVLDL